MQFSIWWSISDPVQVLSAVFVRSLVLCSVWNPVRHPVTGSVAGSVAGLVTGSVGRPVTGLVRKIIVCWAVFRHTVPPDFRAIVNLNCNGFNLFVTKIVLQTSKKLYIVLIAFFQTILYNNLEKRNLFNVIPLINYLYSPQKSRSCDRLFYYSSFISDDTTDVVPKHQRQILTIFSGKAVCRPDSLPLRQNTPAHSTKVRTQTEEETLLKQFFRWQWRIRKPLPFQIK